MNKKMNYKLNTVKSFCKKSDRFHICFSLEGTLKTKNELFLTFRSFLFVSFNQYNNTIHLRSGSVQVADKNMNNKNSL